MNDSISMALILPQWFFGRVLDPFPSVSMNMFPAIGVLGLVVGIGLGLRRRATGLLFFLIPAFLSELLVAASGDSGGFSAASSSLLMLLFFLLIQGLICGLLVYRLKGARVAAFALTLFSLTYALFACVLSVLGPPNLYGMS